MNTLSKAVGGHNRVSVGSFAFTFESALSLIEGPTNDTMVIMK